MSGPRVAVVGAGIVRRLDPEDVALPDSDGALCRLEISVATVEYAVFTARRLAAQTSLPTAE